MILNALDGKPLPVYGDGMQIRAGCLSKTTRARCIRLYRRCCRRTYNIGGHNEKANIEVVKTICTLLEELFLKNRPAWRVMKI